MARKRRGFRGNRAVIGAILREDPGIAAALDAIAVDTAERVRKGGNDVEVRSYVTDRQARAVAVNAEDQAIDGVGTKAINEVRGFASKRDWRAAFARGDKDARARAHATVGGYAALPERRK